MRWTELSREDIALARSEVDDAWSVGDAVLYRLCSDHPVHNDVRQVVAKLWLIGRAYSAAIERRSTARAAAPIAVKNYYRRAAEALIESDLDVQLSRLHGSPETFTDLVPAIEAHACVIRSIGSVSGTCHRSFASKYLHFHYPKWYFIFDGIAIRGLGRLVGRSRAGVLTCSGDDQYQRFVARAWRLREDLANNGHVRLSPRELDRLLLAHGV